MMRVLGIGLVAALAAVALLSVAEAAKLKSKNKAPAASFSELQGITTTVEPVESRSRPRKPKRARR